MTLSPKLGVVEISTLWHFRLPLLIQMFIKVASSPRLRGIGMPSPILWSHLLKMQRIVLLSSLLWWELGTNSLITGPGEWLSLRRFTSKLSWSLILIKINIGHYDIYFMVQWFCLISWRLFEVCTSYFGSMNQYDQTFDLKISVGHCDLYSMVQWFCLISWRLFDAWTLLFGIMSLYDPKFYFKINIGHCDLYFMASDFALHLED